MPAAIYLFTAAAAACLPPPTVDTAARLWTTSPAFASWTIDPSRNRALFNVDFADPRALYLAAQIGGGLLRFGGGGADTMAFATGGGGATCPGNRAGFECLNTTTLDALLALSSAARAPLVIGLALCPDGDPPPSVPWNGSNALELIRYVRKHAPLTIAGYVHTGNSAGDSLVANCSSNGVCGRFGSTLWYADAMGAKARAKYAGFMRQDLVGASYALINTSMPGGALVGGFTPSPDYYFLWAWQRTVGEGVLALALAPPTPQTLRAYAFCVDEQNCGLLNIV